MDAERKKIISDAIGAYFEIDGVEGQTNSKDILKSLGGTAKEQEEIRKQIKALDKELTALFGTGKNNVLLNLRDGDGSSLSIESIKKVITDQKQNLVIKAIGYYSSEIGKIDNDWGDNPKFKEAMYDLSREAYNKGVKSGDEYLLKLQANESLSVLEKMKLTEIYIETIRPVTQYGDKPLLTGLQQAYPLQEQSQNNGRPFSYPDKGYNPFTMTTLPVIDKNLILGKYSNLDLAKAYVLHDTAGGEKYISEGNFDAATKIKLKEELGKMKSEWRTNENSQEGLIKNRNVIAAFMGYDVIKTGGGLPVYSVQVQYSPVTLF